MRDPLEVGQTIRFFSRHLVAFCVAFKIRDEGPLAPEKFQANCGFLLEVRERVFFATAGHIIDIWNEGFSRPDIDIKGSWLWGAFSIEAIENPQVSFDFKQYKQILLFDKSRGLDYAAIELPDRCVEQLLANNVGIISDEGLPSVNEQFDSFLMLGLPARSTHWDGQCAALSPTIMGLSRADLPSDRKNIEFKEFVGQLGRDLSPDGPNNMEGMSGGLVFGLRRRGAQQRYWPFAIQSWCRPDEGLAFACPIRNLADHIATIIDLEKRTT